MKNKLKLGDIFALKTEYSEYYTFGKVLFDVKEQYDKKGHELCYLDWHNSSVLIETYKHVSKKIDIDIFESITPPQFIPKDYLFDEEELIVIGNQKIDCKLVSFPETFKNFQRESFFAVGELAIKTSFGSDFIESYYGKIYPTLGNVYYIQLATLDYSGNKHLIEDPEDITENYFSNSDLKSLPEKRKELYKSIGEDPNISYYELSLKHGYNLARLY